jgi:uncharacterized membrane protein
MGIFDKKPGLIVILISVSLLVVAILVVTSITTNVNFTEFNWSGVSGISDVLMTFVTLILMLSIWQAKDAHDESTKARVQSTNASDAEVLRWAMDEMGKRKKHIKSVTNEYKKELQEILVNGYEYSYNDVEDNHKDQHRMEFVNKLDESKQKEFYEKVDKITGKDWSQDIKDDLHKEVSIIMQRMGYMALFGLISKQHFINLWGPMFLASWYSIEWYIMEERGRLGESSEKNLDPKMFIEQFGTYEGEDSRDYKGAFFRIHLETFIKECENKLPLKLVNNERLKFGRPPLKE